MSRRGASTTNSVPSLTRVMRTDWASVRTPARRAQFVEELLVFSLMYDEVLLQDEVFVLDPAIARWFGDSRFGTLEELLRAGAIRVLRHPLDAFPAEFRLRAVTAPIETRAEYISKLSTLRSDPFAPTTQQIRFYKRLDALLTDPHFGHASRHINSAAFAIMPAFANVLCEVLESERHRPWLNRRFRSEDLNRWDETRKLFVELIRNTPAALARVQAHGLVGQAVLTDQGVPVFNRSLATRVVKTFDEPFHDPLEYLLQSVFTAPFTWREGAIGTYNRKLVEMPFADAFESGVGTDSSSKRVAVEAVVDVPIGLPGSETRFGEAVLAVRESSEGKRLRASMRSLGLGPGFREQIEAWNAVAASLADRVVPGSSVTLRVLAATIGSALVVDTIVSAVKGEITEFPDDLVDGGRLLTSIGGGAAGLLVSPVPYLLNQYGDQVRVRQALEQSVSFRCTPVTAPPFIQSLMASA